MQFIFIHLYLAQTTRNPTSYPAKKNETLLCVKEITRYDFKINALP